MLKAVRDGRVWYVLVHAGWWLAREHKLRLWSAAHRLVKVGLACRLVVIHQLHPANHTHTCVALQSVVCCIASWAVRSLLAQACLYCERGFKLGTAPARTIATVLSWLEQSRCICPTLISAILRLIQHLAPNSKLTIWPTFCFLVNDCLTKFSTSIPASWCGLALQI